MQAAVFILAPPRCCRSVVDGMPGQHPDACGLPELDLPMGDTPGRSGRRCRGPGRSGLLRLLSCLRGRGAALQDAPAGFAVLRIG